MHISIFVHIKYAWACNLKYIEDPIENAIKTYNNTVYVCILKLQSDFNPVDYICE